MPWDSQCGTTRSDTVKLNPRSFIGRLLGTPGKCRTFEGPAVWAGTQSQSLRGSSPKLSVVWLGYVTHMHISYIIINVYVYMYVYIYMHAHTCMYVYIYIIMYVCIYIYISIYIVCTHIYIYILSYVYIYIQTYCTLDIHIYGATKPQGYSDMAWCSFWTLYFSEAQIRPVRLAKMDTIFWMLRVHGRSEESMNPTWVAGPVTAV